jgi:hypothetical protein
MQHVPLCEMSRSIGARCLLMCTLYLYGNLATLLMSC